MSFILDALRKSEHERQRSAVPGLSHVPVATPRRELPAWALFVIGVLASAVLVLGGAWWQSQRLLPVPAASSATAVVPPVASTPPTAAATPPIAAPTPATSPPPAVAPPTVVTATTPAREPAVIVASASSAQDPESAAGLEENTQSLAGAAFVPKRATPTGPTLPSAASLQAQGINVPPLKLELHAYSDKPAERFVFINGRKYREGERLAEGPEVVTIEPNGVVMSEQGQRFQLAPE